MEELIEEYIEALTELELNPSETSALNLIFKRTQVQVKFDSQINTGIDIDIHLIKKLISLDNKLDKLKGLVSNHVYLSDLRKVFCPPKQFYWWYFNNRKKPSFKFKSAFKWLT